MSKGKKVLMTILISISVLLIIFLSFVLAFNITYTESSVKGNSMVDTFYDGDRVYINKFEKGDIGDIVVVDTKSVENWNHSLEGRYIVKRLIAKEGDTVCIKMISTIEYQVVVNDQVVMVKHTDGMSPSYMNFTDYVSRNIADVTRIKDGAVIVKQGEMFLLGDNWNVSYDSTMVGPVTVDSLVGRVDIIVPASKNIFWGTIQGVFKMWFHR